MTIYAQKKIIERILIVSQPNWMLALSLKGSLLFNGIHLISLEISFSLFESCASEKIARSRSMIMRRNINLMETVYGYLTQAMSIDPHTGEHHYSALANKACLPRRPAIHCPLTDLVVIDRLAIRQLYYKA